MDLVTILIWIVVGGVAGWLAGLLVRGGGFGLVGDIILGIAGAILAGWLLPTLGISLGGGIVGAIIGLDRCHSHSAGDPAHQARLTGRLPVRASPDRRPSCDDGHHQPAIVGGDGLSLVGIMRCTQCRNRSERRCRHR